MSGTQSLCGVHTELRNGRLACKHAAVGTAHAQNQDALVQRLQINYCPQRAQSDQLIRVKSRPKPLSLCPDKRVMPKQIAVREGNEPIAC